MAWTDLVESANAAFLATWGVAATLNPQAGGSYSITGVIKNPGMEEALIPGGSPGPAVTRFWIDYAKLSPKPAEGDHVSINGTNYSIGQVEIDVEGSALLRLREDG